MGYLAQATLNAIEADPTKCETYYNSVRSTFLNDLGSAYSGVPESVLRFMWCGMVAHHLKPYGNSNASTMEDLLAAPALDCDNYATLAIRLYQMMTASNDAGFAIMGWNGGAIGNHAQILAWSPDASWAVLIDPTVCVFAKTGYNSLVMGMPATGIKNFYWQWTDLLPYLATVQTALSSGSYRPYDCMYFFRSLEAMWAPGGRPYWATPQA